MAETFSSLSTITLPDTSFIGGTYKEFDFDVFDAGGNPVDISSFTYGWALSPYGQPDITTIYKAGTLASVPDNNRFTIILYSYDTISLSGKFVHQPILFGNYGYDQRLAQGYMNIISGVATT